MNSWEIFSKIIILTKKPIVLHWLHWIFIKIYDFFQKWSFNLDCLFQKKWYFWSKSDFEEKWNRNYLILGTVSCIFFSLIIFSVQFFLYIIFLFIACCCCLCYEKSPQRMLLYEYPRILIFYILALESTTIETSESSSSSNPRWIHQIRLESNWGTWILCDILTAFDHYFHSPTGHLRSFKVSQGQVHFENWANITIFKHF